MASAVTVQYLGSRQLVKSYLHIPNSTAATVLTYDQGSHFIWLDMQNYDLFLVVASNAILTGNGLTLLEIIAGTSATGANPTQIVASAALTGTALNNGGSLEISAVQLREIGAANSLTLRYVSARLTVQNASDQCSVSLTLRSKTPLQNLTPATM